MVTGFEIYPVPTSDEPLVVETLAVRLRWRLAALGRWLWDLVTRYLGAPRGEGGATL